ncbi:hypothetical protein BIV57_09705 [Mangrovactinospora gilvigrisea]|uniref:Uncharacterized protein n=1 Tax=Mangrovactinospora gilvigrisea TaxID=1428644 RepID=A0A1J7C841_9ACTN|nr:hypothetical protein BIV57_09705 [Mangrovactinospora gilvigrisea]
MFLAMADLEAIVTVFLHPFEHLHISIINYRDTFLWYCALEEGKPNFAYLLYCLTDLARINGARFNFISC